MCVIFSNSNPKSYCVFLDQTKSRERGERELEMKTIYSKLG